MFLKALLIGLVAALTAIEGGWFGECKFREPLVTGALVGMILGDVKNGVIIGGELQLVWMGATGIGLAPGLAIGPGGTIGAAFALMTDSGIETAIAFGLPASILIQSLNSIRCTINSTLMHRADAYAAKADEAGMLRVHLLCGFITVLVNAVPTFLTVYVGAELVQSIVDNLPAWVSNGLGGIAALIPTLGFAMLMQILMEASLVPYFIIGFVLATYLGMDMISITALGVAIAIIAFYVNSKQPQAANKEDDEL